MQAVRGQPPWVKLSSDEELGQVTGHSEVTPGHGVSTCIYITIGIKRADLPPLFVAFSICLPNTRAVELR